MVIQPVSSLFEYFLGALREVGDRRGEVFDHSTSDYLARMLASLAEGSRSSNFGQSIVLALDEVLAQPPAEQLVGLQHVADSALCVVGFFPSSYEGRGLEGSLYVHLGTFAYGRLAQLSRVVPSAQTPLPVYLTLENQFPRYADLVSEVAESSSLGAVTRDLVRLFDRWKTTGSTRALEAMARAGAFPSLRGSAKC